MKKGTSQKAKRTGLLIEITEYLRLPLHPNKTVILNLSLRHCCRLHVKLVICQSTCSSRQLPLTFKEKPNSSGVVLQNRSKNKNKVLNNECFFNSE